MDRNPAEARVHAMHAIAELARFTRDRGRPLRVGCGILPGPIATILAMQADIQSKHSDQIILALEMDHASGVELVSAAAREPRDTAFDFLVAATGAASLTLVGTQNCRDYRPLFPVHYEKQVCLYRSSSKARPVGIKQLSVYAASSGLEEALIRRHELDIKEIVQHELFTTLVELLIRVDDGQAINVWDPLSEYLEKRFGWCRAIATPYLSQICLYQHTSLNKAFAIPAADAFKTLFLHHWVRLAEDPYKALGYLFDQRTLKHQFAIGSGMTIPIQNLDA